MNVGNKKLIDFLASPGTIAFMGKKNKKKLKELLDSKGTTANYTNRQGRKMVSKIRKVSFSKEDDLSGILAAGGSLDFNEGTASIETRHRR